MGKQDLERIARAFNDIGLELGSGFGEVDSEGDFLPKHIRDYTIVDVTSKSLHEPEKNQFGAMIYSELLTFSDSYGHTVVRPATVFVSNKKHTEPVPNALVDSDPWLTGPRGLNRTKINMYTELGFSGLWLSHADQRSPLQPNKSVTRSAHQMHHALRWLDGGTQLDTENVFLNGYSRGGMTAEKFIALSSLYGVKVLFSNLDAPSFAQDPSAKELVEIAMQVPDEVVGLISLIGELVRRSVASKNPGEIVEYAKTFNVHPKNMVQEAMWAVALFRAHVGPILSHMPKNSTGLRTFFGSDALSQEHHYRTEYERFANILVLPTIKGPHLTGARPTYVEMVKKPQMQTLAELILAHEKPDPQTIAGSYSLAA